MCDKLPPDYDGIEKEEWRENASLVCSELNTKSERLMKRIRLYYGESKMAELRNNTRSHMPRSYALHIEGLPLVLEQLKYKKSEQKNAPDAKSRAVDLNVIYEVFMENELVHSKKNDVFCDSRIIAEKFGKQHNKIVDKIEWLITKLKEDNEIHSLFGGAGDFKFIKVEKKYRGQSFKCYEMGKKEFLLIAMHISGTKALKHNMANIISMLLMEESLASIYENWAEIPGKRGTRATVKTMKRL